MGDAAAVETSTPASGGTALSGGDATPADGSALAGGTPAAGSSDAGTGGATPQPATPPVAEWKLKVPDGFSEDDGFKSFSKMAQESGLKSDAAQKFLDMHATNMRAAATAVKQSAEQAVLKKYGLEGSEKWAEALKADKEIGGAQYDANLQAAQRVVQQFGTPALREWFSKGYGDHPELVRFVAKIGKAMGEDSMAGAAGKGNAHPSNNDDAFHRQIYPRMFAEQDGGLTS